MHHGNTTLFATLNIATGSIIEQCFPCHHRRELLSCPRTLDIRVTNDFDVHLVMDNCATYKPLPSSVG